MPRPPGFLGSHRYLFRPGDFPNPFSTILDVPQVPAAIPPLVYTAGIGEAMSVTSKLIAAGCGRRSRGWIVLAARAGVLRDQCPRRRRLEQRRDRHAEWRPHGARVVLFDPDTDLAVLFAPALSLRPLVVVDSTPARGTSGAVIGYPGGGAEQVVPAAVSGAESATGYNIYGDALVTRKIEVLAARVIPGNSGGPIVDVDGQVIGVVFAASTTELNVGYALTIPQVYPTSRPASIARPGIHPSVHRLSTTAGRRAAAAALLRRLLPEHQLERNPFCTSHVCATLATVWSEPPPWR